MDIVFFTIIYSNLEVSWGQEAQIHKLVILFVICISITTYYSIAKKAEKTQNKTFTYFTNPLAPVCNYNNKLFIYKGKNLFT